MARSPRPVARGCCNREPRSARQKFKIRNYPRSASLWPSASFKERTMTILKWALIFFLVSVVAGILGFTDISVASADVARFLFYVFVVIFLVLLILGLTIFRV
jgi:uncharacterized membrane protein YtjA (UPF0391 family)